MSPTVHTGLGSGDFVKVEGVETALISMETGIEGETSDPSYYPDKQEEGGVACPQLHQKLDSLWRKQEAGLYGS